MPLYFSQNYLGIKLFQIITVNKEILNFYYSYTLIFMYLHLQQIVND